MKSANALKRIKNSTIASALVIGLVGVSLAVPRGGYLAESFSESGSGVQKVVEEDTVPVGVKVVGLRFNGLEPMLGVLLGAGGLALVGAIVALLSDATSSSDLGLGNGSSVAIPSSGDSNSGSAKQTTDVTTTPRPRVTTTTPTEIFETEVPAKTTQPSHTVSPTRAKYSPEGIPLPFDASGYNYKDIRFGDGYNIPKAPSGLTDRQYSENLFNIQNMYRQYHGIRPLKWDETLYRNSLRWNKQMIAANEARMGNVIDFDSLPGFEHSPDNVWENIGIDYGPNSNFTPIEKNGGIFTGWKSSPGHNRNMLEKGANRGAIAVTRVSGNYHPRTGVYVDTYWATAQMLW
ncbi:CAP domain-containing protein [Corynebacterium renale]|uniref:Uncharacterized protein YkwD n=1 Tax=Corynebacterium renale TaxID=1724 RepID=A0A2A9DMC1_9CORY|nr:CAP domain-containing protein [Corynebacterium renale]PFG27315.1 uncharacterized protein YkwD [Corynebacterium renale]SQI23599.1 putative secreted protein [Corynebacterium renale]